MRFIVTVRYDGGQISTMHLWRDSIIKLEPCVNADTEMLDGAILTIRLNDERRRLWIKEDCFALENRIAEYDRIHGRYEAEE